MTIIYTNQKSKKRKANAKQRELQSSWEKILKKYEPKEKVKSAKIAKPAPYRRETTSIPSLGSNVGECTKKDTIYYTGNSMIGIATLHKSNAVPLFSQEDAVEVSRMRRG